MIVIERSDIIEDYVLVPKSGIARQSDIVSGNELAIQNTSYCDVTRYAMSVFVQSGTIQSYLPHQHNL